MRIGETGGREGCTGRRIPQPVGIWWSNIDNRMVHMPPARGANLRHLYPPVLGESCGHDFICVFNIATRGNTDGLWHLDHTVRLWYVPAFNRFFGLRSLA